MAEVKNELGPIQRKGLFLWQEDSPSGSGMNLWSGLLSPNNGYPQEHAERAAMLFSASPALYEALRNLVVMLPSDCPEIEGSERVPKGLVYIRWQDLREARAALALAEGKKE